MNSFEYKLNTHVWFGIGAAVEHLAEAVGEYGRKIMLTCGMGSVKKTGVFDEIKRILEAAGKEVIEFSGIMPNPTYSKVQEGAALARREKADCIVALGGGSVIDCSKVISAQAKTDEDIWRLEHEKGIIPEAHIPLVAVVTLPGTGSEMNNEGVITNEALGKKDSVYGCFPAKVIIDPGYTKTVPMRQYMSCCFDELSHCMETYFGKSYDKNVLSDDMNEACMRNIIKNTRAVLADPEAIEPRSELAWASSMAETGIFKLSKVTDFQAHMIEHQIGAYTDCNHGMGLAVIHPAMYRRIYKNAEGRFARFASEVMGVETGGKTAEELALAGIEALEALIREMGLPLKFSEMGIDDLSVMRKAADTAYIREGCAKQFARDELYEFLAESI